MSCASSWRLYPKRSIASHSICGSGRLFRGFNDGKREVGSDITWLVTELPMVAKDTNNPELAQECQSPDRLSRNFLGSIFPVT